MGRLIDDKMLWNAHNETVRHLRRFCRADQDDAEDAVSEAMALAVEHYEDIEREADYGCMEARLQQYLKVAANRALSRIRRVRAKTLSLDAPMSEDEDDGADFMSAVVARTTNFDTENYCDAMRVIRLCHRLPPEDATILALTAEGLTADDIAIETGKTPGRIRMDRTRIIHLIRQSIQRGADI